ncbi:MAG: recombination regulator RecX [Betaproteobacteria bacterium]|nr:recombination regulator RecX [Betaproteobacteria bacterium]
MKNAPSLRDRALRYLGQREHSRAELARKLGPHAQSEEELETVLDKLAEGRQLSDERYAGARSRQLSKKYGSARILHDLKSRGVDAELAKQTAALARDGDLERARDIWRRKFRAPPANREDQARHMRFLQSRGFSFDVIRAVLKDRGDSED